MATEFTWKIEQCERDPATGAITVAHWRCTGVGGDHTATRYSSANIPAAPEGAPFTPFDAVTEADVLGWVWAAGVDQAGTEAAINGTIAELKNPEAVKGTPWDS